MKIAISLCPNDIYVFAGMILGNTKKNFDIEISTIKNLNHYLKEPHFDFIKVSSYALLGSPHYRVTRVGASLVRNKGPQLVTNKKLTSKAKNTLAVPSLLATSTFLAKYYFPHLEPIEYCIKDIGKAVAQGQTQFGVIINEDMHQLPQLQLTSVCDLGLKWNRDHDSHLPLGVIAAKDSLAKQAVTSFESSVEESIQWAKQNPTAALEQTIKMTGSKDLNRSHVDVFTKDAQASEDILADYKKMQLSLNHLHRKN